MDYQINLVKDLVTVENRLFVSIFQLQEDDIIDLMKHLENVEVDDIHVKLEVVLSDHILKRLVEALKKVAPIHSMQLNSKFYSKKVMLDLTNVLSEYYVFTKVDGQSINIVIEMLEIPTDEFTRNNNINLINNLKSMNLVIEEHDMLGLIQLVESMNTQVAALQGKIKSKEQAMERLKKQINAGAYDSQNENYNKLMEKYKDTLRRLENLRNSKLGKLQIKYWDLKG